MKCFFLLILGPFKVKIMTRKGLFELMKRFSENYFVKRMYFLGKLYIIRSYFP